MASLIIAQSNIDEIKVYEDVVSLYIKYRELELRLTLFDFSCYRQSRYTHFKRGEVQSNARDYQHAYEWYFP